MSKSVVNFTGNVTKNPLLRQVGEQSVCNVSVAVHTTWKDKKNPGGYVTNFYNCTVWGKQGEYMAEKLKTGMKVSVTGELCVNTYESKTGGERPSLDVKVAYIDIENVMPKTEAANKRNTESEDAMPF